MQASNPPILGSKSGSRPWHGSAAPTRLSPGTVAMIRLAGPAFRSALDLISHGPITVD